MKKALSIIILSSFILACGKKEESNVISKYTVQKDKLEISITENGQLSSSESVKITTKTRGEVLWVVEDGTEVKKGDKLLTLDSSKLEDSISEFELKIESQKRGIKTSESELTLFRLDSEQKTNENQRALKFAEMALQHFLEGSSPIKRKDLELDIERAKLSLEDSQEKHEKMPALLEKGFITQTECKQSKLDLTKNKQELEKKQQALEIYNLFEYPQELDKKKSDVEKSKINIKRQKTRVETQIVEKLANIKNKKLVLDKEVSKQKERFDSKNDFSIIAPDDGVVVLGDGSRWGDTQKPEVGKAVHKNQKVMRLPNLKKMVVKLAVNEINIEKIKVGMKTKSTIEALGDNFFTGEIKKIATTANNNWRSTVKEYEAEVTLENTNGRGFRPGMSAKTIIIKEIIKDVLILPISAIYEKNNQAYCYIENKDKITKKDIVVGKSNNEYIVIKEGLAENDIVLLLVTEPKEEK